jgi:membrane-bound lytic murein transglycosylase D
MLHIRHYLLTSVVFLSACTFQTKKPGPIAQAQNPQNTTTQTPQIQAPQQNPTPSSAPLITLANTSDTVNSSSDLWGRMRKGFSLNPIPANKLQNDLAFYGRYPSFMNGVSQRGSRFMFYVVDELEKRKMPMELALIPVIESAYDPKARSPGGAAGLWQMMDGTGRVLGLKRTAVYDGRHDVVASTDAALDYLQRLGKKFNGDWHLALAAYNCGEMTVTNAVARNKAKGLPTDFWSLPLPAHTKTYIPKIMAIREIITTPAKYKVDLHPIPNRPYFAKVNVDSAISLSAAADVTGVDVKDLQALNPALTRAATDPLISKSLLVPASSAQTFASALNNMPDKSQLAPKQAPSTQLAAATKPNKVAPEQGGKITHELKKGESLWTLSKRYKVSMDQIAQWNNLKPKQDMKPGKQLIIWQR